MARFSRFWLWHAPAGIAVIAAILFGIGFWLAVRGTAGARLGAPPPAPEPRAAAKPAGKRRLLVLGDSLSRGTGDPTGKGYATEVADFLRRRGPVESVNLAVSGAESADLLRLVESANVRSLAASADLILVSIGGNDLSHSFGRIAGPAEALSSVTDARARLAQNLRAVLGALRQANPAVPIRVLGLYQPFTGEGREIRVGLSLVQGWNSLVAETALGYSNTVAVPVFDLFYGRTDRLATDRFHPNREGYRAIAERVIQTLP